MRIRSIWPGFWTSPTITQLPFEIRLCFIGLWNYADDEGRALCNYRLLKGALFPLDDEVTANALERWMDVLEGVDLIRRYLVKETMYYTVKSWDEFQRPNKPKKSKFPPPPATRHGHGTDEEGTRQVGVIITPRGDGLREGKGKEGKGREGKGTEESPSPADLVVAGDRNERELRAGLADHADALAVLDGLTRSARSPFAVIASLRALGPGGTRETGSWADVAVGLVEAAALPGGPPSPNLIAGCVRKAKERRGQTPPTRRPIREVA